VKPPLTLAIESSNPSAAPPSVALVAAQEVLGTEPVESRPHTDDLITAIDRLFKRTGRQPRDLTAVAVSIGPGGYTAVRIAITTAKLICEATGAACHPIPTAHAVAARVESDKPFGVALASKGESTFLTRFQPRTGPGLPAAIEEGHLITAADLGSLDIPLLIIDRFAPPALVARAAQLGIELRPPTLDPIAAAQLAPNFPALDPAALAPLYPREPEAVTKWKQLKTMHKGG
jgi:tRNA threonylcarbamoyl adenosine modification protein YeaZ